ncbi:hypothetical protein [Glutamicibacter arilaitensis]|uniref:hypothetical protein n=1 Tax=Glutamicibacter arilaitensis TaxID=256701 RepID=UPI00384B91D0
MTIIQDRLDQLTRGEITLDKGAHIDFETGHCAMEVVAYLAGLGHTDAPECSSPVLRTYTININDAWDEVQRQKLIPFLPRMVGTNGDGKDEQRSYLALDWLIRTYTPAWLELAGLKETAQELRDLRRIVDMVAAENAGVVVLKAEKEASAAWSAARSAAWSAARSAARSAAWSAAWSAARSAAESAAESAAWSAAESAAESAARSAAESAARSAAESAAWSAARSAAESAARSAAESAAWSAAEMVLAPTVETLQASALELLESMINPA